MKKILKKFKRYWKSGDFWGVVTYLVKNKMKLFSYRYCLFFIKKRMRKKIDGFMSREFELTKIYHPKQFISGHLSDERKAIVDKANKYVEHKFELLGSGEVILEPIKWNIDFKSGFEWTIGKFYKEYVQENIENSADVKVPRELSRCHHFLTLAMAYLFTHDKKYVNEFLFQIKDWIEKNPLMYSINWGCTMDVSIRAVNWLWALSMFSDDDMIDEKIKRGIIFSLYEHGWFIYRNPEKSKENNHNHYLADLSGQVLLGLFFSNDSEGKKWLEEGIKELFFEIRNQILPSGVSYERSTNYNRLELELILIPILILHKNNFEIPQDIWFRLDKMFEFIMYSLKPDGNTPIIGDQDDGRLLPFGLESNIDYRYLLSIACILFKNSQYKSYGNGYNSYCHFLLGKDSYEEYGKIKRSDCELTSRAFPDAGFFIMRRNKTFMFINNSGKGFYSDRPSSGTHTHSDLLSFELFFKGLSAFIDPGSYLYTSDKEERYLFRTTSMHNTAIVDGMNQNTIHKDILWDFENNAVPKVLIWESNEDYDCFEGEHSGYQRLLDPVSHRRRILFSKKNEEFNITDVLEGKKAHVFDIFFHLDIGVDFEINNNAVYVHKNRKTSFHMTFHSDQKFELLTREGWVSKAYGKKSRANILVITAKEIVTFTLNTKIF